METEEFWLLGHVSDEGLRRGLSELCASSYRIEARVVAHLAEVERRRLFLKDGFSSLYKYCLVQLGLSQDSAFYRMTAARIGLRFPIAFALLEQGRIHLSGLCLLRDFLTTKNHRELLAAAAGKTKLQIREELSRRFPGARVADSIRKLPKKRLEPVIGPAPAAAGSALDATSFEENQQSRSSGSVAQSDGRQVDIVDPVTGEVTTGSIPQASDEQAQPTARSTAAHDSDDSPLHDVRYRVQFDVSRELKAKLELALALSSHANPKGDFEALFGYALDLYVAHLQKKRFAKTDKPRAPTAQAASAGRSQRLALRGRPASKRVPRDSVDRNRAHIPNATRREIVERDGLRCAYVSPSGHRCDERAFLQMHHDQPWAREGGDDPENLRIFCSGHNRFMAEQDFGAEHVARCIEQARARRTPA